MPSADVSFRSLLLRVWKHCCIVESFPMPSAAMPQSMFGRYLPMPSADVGSWSNLGVARFEAVLYSRKLVRCEVM